MSQEEQRFNISLGDRDPVEVVGRSEAVAYAKQLSAENPNQNVSLERADNMVSMQFREGMLEVFVTETREKTKSRPRKDRAAEESAEADSTENLDSEGDAADEAVEVAEEAPAV